MKEESIPRFADMEENLEVEGNQAVDQGGKLELDDSDSVMSGQDQQVELTLPTSGMKEIVSNPAKLSLTPDMRFKDWAIPSGSCAAYRLFPVDRPGFSLELYLKSI